MIKIPYYYSVKASDVVLFTLVGLCALTLDTNISSAINLSSEKHMSDDVVSLQAVAEIPDMLCGQLLADGLNLEY